MRLTKSKYCKGLNCPKALYLSVHQPELATPFSHATKLRLQQGNEVGQFAQTFFPGGILIAEDHQQLDMATSKTKTLIDHAKVPAIFEATFSFEGVLCRVDILRNNFDGTWDIFEVKSSKSVKAEHHDDVSLQYWVLLHSGVKIRRAYLRCISTSFRSPQWQDFFRDEDLTEIAKENFKSKVPLQVSAQMNLLAEDTPPSVQLGSQCDGCEFYEHCWSIVPPGSTLELYRAPQKFDIFYHQYKLIKDIDPAALKLTAFQIRQWQASQTDDPIVDQQAITHSLKKLQFPLYFFDFETIGFALPPFEGMAAYEKIPVQWSCHIMTADLKVEHKEFLFDPESNLDPREACAHSLRDLFQNTEGNIIAYHASFEKRVIEELAKQVPSDRAVLSKLATRFWDLEDIFKRHYYHKDMRGSCSIKKVLPHFAHELDYGDLEVKDGGDAEALLLQLCTQRLPAEEALKARNALLKYCERDTQAMLVIYSKLRLIGEKDT